MKNLEQDYKTPEEDSQPEPPTKPDDSYKRC